MNVYDCANQLARSLSESSEFQRFDQMRRFVDADPKSKEMITNFQMKQWELQQAQMSGGKMNEEKLSQLQKLYDIIILNPMVRDYLEAEMRFGRIMSDVQRIIGKAVGMDDLPGGPGES